MAPINDIALIRLAKDIEYNERIQPVKLATKDDEKNLKSAVLTGWGSHKVIAITLDVLIYCEILLCCANIWFFIYQ